MGELVQKFDYGSTVRVAVTFIDAEGNFLNPARASLTLYYSGIDDGTSEAKVMPLTAVGNEWVAFWDSQVARPGYVSCYAYGDGAEVKFDFELLRSDPSIGG